MVLITCYNCSEEKTNEGCVYGTLGLVADGNLQTTAGKWRAMTNPNHMLLCQSEPGRESASQSLPKTSPSPLQCWRAKEHNVTKVSKTCTAAEPDLSTSELCHFSAGTRDGAGPYGSPPRGAESVGAEPRGTLKNKMFSIAQLQCVVLGVSYCSLANTDN